MGSWTFESNGETLTSDSTIRFRSAEEVHVDLAAAAFTVIDLLDAPDRPGKELVFVAERPGVTDSPVSDARLRDGDG